eukprot:GFUD01006085.1.p2 GENE.GFUD01006085.1~~GFUD01006085.1.p2  ORF type:complete len:158 (-),score=42.05 GFUD01006085.1:260-733(-)
MKFLPLFLSLSISSTLSSDCLTANCRAGSVCGLGLAGTCTQGTACLPADDGNSYCMLQGITLNMDCSDNRGSCMIGTACKNGRCRRATETGKVAGRPCKTGRCALGLRCQEERCTMDTCIPVGEEYRRNDRWGEFGICCSGVQTGCGEKCLCGEDPR